MSATSTKRGAFTLVEILVVIGIVALLAGILLSVFSRARNSARTASCASNLRQIGAAFQMYVTDHRGSYPPVDVLNMDCEWANYIYPYTRSTAVFSCPSFDYGEFRPGCPPKEPTGNPDFPFNNWRGSYNYNIFPTLRTGFIGRFNEVRLRAPSETILFCDGTGVRETYGSTSAGGSVDGIPINIRDFSDLGNRHNYGSNVAYADGHVKWKSYDSLLDIQQWKPR